MALFRYEDRSDPTKHFQRTGHPFMTRCHLPDDAYELTNNIRALNQVPGPYGFSDAMFRDKMDFQDTKRGTQTGTTISLIKILAAKYGRDFRLKHLESTRAGLATELPKMFDGINDTMVTVVIPTGPSSSHIMLSWQLPSEGQTTPHFYDSCNVTRPKGFINDAPGRVQPLDNSCGSWVVLKAKELVTGVPVEGVEPVDPNSSYALHRQLQGQPPEVPPWGIKLDVPRAEKTFKRNLEAMTQSLLDEFHPHSSNPEVQDVTAKMANLGLGGGIVERIIRRHCHYRPMY